MPHVHDDHDDAQSSPCDESRASHDGSPTLRDDAVRRERELPCSTEDAWVLLRDAEGLERWLADDVELQVAAGEEGTIRDGDETLVVLVDEVEVGRRLSLRWWSGDGEPSLVDITVDPVGDDRSRLVVTELPMRLVSVPQAVPTHWTAIDGGAGTTGPQARALAFAR